ncbi:hypothetical protein [Nocardioides bruguierae]|uniref:hypothetical protein n=1 Tax=Nocardioides bruguierae TaxID=2945102 RepID=UPI00201FBF0B|nr:hypothetical protein [Nocardioides bruguierae]MCL8026701.1 hypothetical protein [Nocardioides bruguierae]
MPLSNRPGDELVGRYRLVDLLSESRGGRFWRAHDRVLERQVAVHVISEDDDRADALLDAARRSATVLDPHILRVLDAARADGLCFVVNEWGSGTSLDTMLSAGGPLPPRQAAWLAGEVAQATRTAHRAGVPHGRLVPESVLVDSSGSVRIIGWCVDAALHGRGAGSTEDDLADLAGLLYAGLTARWGGPSSSSVPAAPRDHDRVLRPRQVRAGIPRPLDSLCDALLNPDGDEARSAEDVVEELEDFVGDDTGLRRSIIGRLVTPEPRVSLPAVPDFSVRETAVEQPTQAWTPPADLGAPSDDSVDTGDTVAVAAAGAAAGAGAAAVAAGAHAAAVGDSDDQPDDQPDDPGDPGEDLSGGQGEAATAEHAAVPAADDPLFGDVPPASGEVPDDADADDAESTPGDEADDPAEDEPDLGPATVATLPPQPAAAPGRETGVETGEEKGSQGHHRPAPGPPPEPLAPVPARPLFAPDPEDGGPARRTRHPAPTGPEPDPEYWPWETGTGTVPPMLPPEDDDVPPPRSPGRRTLTVAAVLLVLLGLFVALTVAWNVGRGRTPLGAEPTTQETSASATDGTSASAEPTPLTGLTATDLDPLADPPEENPELAPNAVDGDASTSWVTSTYIQDLGPSGLKTGVGLVVDLQDVTSVDSVRVQLRGRPTGFSLYLTDDEVTTDPAAVDGLEPVASRGRAGTDVTVDLDGAQGRYLTLWLTSLPTVDGGFRGEVREITVLAAEDGS